MVKKDFEIKPIKNSGDLIPGEIVKYLVGNEIAEALNDPSKIKAHVLVRYEGKNRTKYCYQILVTLEGGIKMELPPKTEEEMEELLKLHET